MSIDTRSALQTAANSRCGAASARYCPAEGGSEVAGRQPSQPLNQALFRCRDRTYRNVKPMRSMSTPYSSRSNGTSPGAQLQSAARLATLPARLHRRRLGPAARGDKHRGSGKRCRSGVQRTHLTAVPTELHACLMRAPASASPSIGPHNRSQHGRQQRDQGQRLAVSAEELPLIWCVHALIIARDLSLIVRTLKPVKTQPPSSFIIPPVSTMVSTAAGHSSHEVPDQLHCTHMWDVK